jgi:hypothetical protein
MAFSDFIENMKHQIALSEVTKITVPYGIRLPGELMLELLLRSIFYALLVEI